MMDAGVNLGEWCSSPGPVKFINSPATPGRWRTSIRWCTSPARFFYDLLPFEASNILFMGVSWKIQTTWSIEHAWWYPWFHVPLLILEIPFVSAELWGSSLRVTIFTLRNLYILVVPFQQEKNSENILVWNCVSILSEEWSNLNRALKSKNIFLTLTQLVWIFTEYSKNIQR